MSRSLRPLLQAVRQGGGLCKRCHSTSTIAAESSTSAQARLRFAPSPTGHLHLGGLRTALFNHLLARKWGGKWLLRIEDTDRTRYTEGAVDSLRQALEWAGLEYDEGVGAGGSYGPYTQSERLDIYRHHTKELLSRDEAYECFCTPDELQAIKLSIHQQGMRHSYDGRCKHLTQEEVGRRKRAGHKYVVRYKSTSQGVDIPHDLIFGEHQPDGQLSASVPDDFVLMKSDGWPTYHLASVIDDHAMEITHVLRGEEWLPSLPKHHQLYRAFGWEPPQFGHLPLLINADGSKLSKRRGDTFVQHYQKQGYEPEALLNFLALMGWDYHSALTSSLEPHVRTDGHSLHELFTLPQLIDAFDIKHVNHRKAAVNQSKLDFLNKMTLRRKAGRLGKDGLMVNAGKAEVDAIQEGQEREELLRRYQGMLKEVKVLQSCELVEGTGYVEKVFEAELPRTVLMTDMPYHSIFYFLPPNYTCQESQTILKDLNPRLYCQYVSLFADTLQSRAQASNGKVDEDLTWDVIHDLMDQLKLDKKPKLLVPIRHALTERKKGPSIPELVAILGLDETLSRLRRGEEYVRASSLSNRQNQKQN